MPGAQPHPQPRVQSVESTRVSSPQVGRNARHSLRNGVNGCFVLSLVCRAC
jgi:hypothetical protein